MKKIALCLWLTLSMVLSPDASAADTQPNVSIEPNPALTHKSLSTITVQYLDARYGIAPDVDVSDITLMQKGGTSILYALPSPSIDYAKLTLEFAWKGDTEAATLTQEGIYTLHIPDGAVKTFDTMSPLPGIDTDFTISANATNEMTYYVLAPAPGKVDDISTVEISFPDSNGLDWFHNDLFGSGNFSAITLSLKDDPSVTYTATKKKFDNNFTVTLGFNGEASEVTVTTPGTYVLDIPAGMFMKDFSTVTNSHITAEYIIGATVAPEFDGMVASPANGSSAGRFSELSLTFPNMPDGLEYPITNISEATLTTPSGDIFYGFSPSVGSANGGTYNRLTLQFAPKNAVSVDDAATFTEAGEYAVNIPAGILKAYGKEAVNNEISLKFNVDPMLDFTYNVSPAANVCHQSFTDIIFSCGSSLKSISVNPDCAARPTISLGQTSYTLAATNTSACEVTLSLPTDAVAVPGLWTVTIPATFFSGVTANGTEICNTDEITSQFRIKLPERFNYTVEPADGATVEFFKNITLEFTGENLKEVRINSEAGQPTMTGTDGSQLILDGRLSGHYVIFTAQNGAGISDGSYTVTIPAGYIATVDRDNLVAEVDQLTTTLTVSSKTVSDYTDGILFLNEGWFGHDSGSLNFFGNNGEWTYDVFARNNAAHSLGITSQYGQCFGDRIYIVSKQSHGDTGSDGGVFTVIDAATMKFAAQINRLPDNTTQPRSFCAWDAHKGYLSTKDHIYTVDLDRMEVISVVPGTDIYTSFDSNGEMLRYGNHIFAIRQSSGVDAIDPSTDDVVRIPAELAVAFAVTPDGSMYVATRNENNEFVKISPENLSITETFDIPDDYAKIANIWSTWRKAPLAADITSNVVYYVTQKAADESKAGARTVARYDFDNKKFDESFITLPGVADGEDTDWILYGEGISVDPATGYILLTAVESGYGAHYSKNRVFIADPANGKILPDRTLILKDAYWFPAMALYPDFDAPEIDSQSLALSSRNSTFSLDVAAVTSLATGNRHLINYKAESSDTNVCTVEASDKPGTFDVTILQPDALYSITISADYQGKISTAVISSGTLSTGSITINELPAVNDVYNLQGICIRRGATPDDINSLPVGVYIINGRKYMIR